MLYHQVIYDVSHNIAKVEEHMVNGRPRSLLVHRKGSTRAFPPHHPLIPVDYQFTGQPVLVGGTMGTCSYVLTGTERGMEETFGSTCHGAGRAKSRAGSRRQMDYTEVLEALQSKGIAIRVASPKLVMEEAPQSDTVLTRMSRGRGLRSQRQAPSPTVGYRLLHLRLHAPAPIRATRDSLLRAVRTACRGTPGAAGGGPARGLRTVQCAQGAPLRTQRMRRA